MMTLFPKDFLWGAATASYQIEGAVNEDGRGACIWHCFSHTQGKVKNGDTGDVACDHYHRYPEDINLMKALGLQSYRFSVAWARVLPQGVGAVNEAGLDFYDRLIDGLLAADITPFLTLYHWDLPHALQEKGGWANPDSVQWFVDYADLVSKRYGDRVPFWLTHNEPAVIAFVGNWYGHHAPGIQDLPTALKVSHHLMLSHGQAVPVIRQNVPHAQVGITLNLIPQEPLTDDPADIAAAHRMDGFQNRWFLDPVFKGSYPADMLEILAKELDGIDTSAVSVAAAPLDFLGENFYTRNLYVHDDAVYPFKAREVKPEGAAYTAMNWEVHPDALRRLLVRVQTEYNPPAMYITENGAAYDDPPPAHGVVEDPQRVAYYAAHFDALAQAIDEGVKMKGYFAWSLLDNFEWAEGYAKRFGIIYVDFATQERTLKRSAEFYRDFIRHQ